MNCWAVSDVSRELASDLQVLQIPGGIPLLVPAGSEHFDGQPGQRAGAHLKELANLRVGTLEGRQGCASFIIQRTTHGTLVCRESAFQPLVQALQVLGREGSDAQTLAQAQADRGQDVVPRHYPDQRRLVPQEFPCFLPAINSQPSTNAHRLRWEQHVMCFCAPGGSS